MINEVKEKSLEEIDELTTAEAMLTDEPIEKLKPSVRHALAVFSHGASVEEALDRGDSDRATWEIMCLDLIHHDQLNRDLVADIIAEKFEAVERAEDEWKQVLRVAEECVFPMLESAESQQAGFKAYNEWQQDKKNKKAARARKLRAQNWKQSAIAEELGISTITVRRYLIEK